MNIDHEYESGEARNLSVKYDKSDLGARGILIFFLVLLVSAIAIHLCVLGLYVGMTKYADEHAPEISPLATKTFTPRAEILTNTLNVNIEQFPQPRLLTHIRGPAGEMSKFLQQETSALMAPPWKDAEGNVHLPIEEAMKMVVPRLPVRAGGEELPNYPGAGQDYSHPVPPYESSALQSATASESDDAGQMTREAAPAPASQEKSGEGR